MSMMRFTDRQLEQLAAWEPADERFSGGDPIADYITPVIDRLRETGDWHCYIVESGSLGNYFSFAIRPSYSKDEIPLPQEFQPYRGDGLLVYLSLLCPVGAIGITSIINSSRLFAFDPLELNSLLVPSKGDSGMVDAILDAFEDSIYQILDAETLSQALPAHITPYEYCLCNEPWDRVFHVLFSNTD